MLPEGDSPQTPQTQQTGFTQSSGATSSPGTSPLVPEEHTPYTKTENGSGRHTASSSKAANTHFRLGYENLPKCVGPMPVQSTEHHQNFLDEFLPLPDSIQRDKDMPSFLGSAFELIPTNPRSENHLYMPFAAAFNENSSKFKAVLTHEVSEGGSTVGSSKPDISIYPNEPNLQREYTRNGKAFCELSLVDIFVEVKRSKADDCFRDGPGSFIDFPVNKPAHELPPSAQNQISTLGQSAYYATKILERQYRTAVFSIMMFGSWIRLLRWDQAGVTVSKAFDVREQPQILCEFIWRLEQLGPEARGYDTTVDKHGDTMDRARFGATLTRRLQFELDIDDKAAREEVNRHLDPAEISKVSGMKDSGGQLRNYLISKPTCVSLSPTGRGTRGYWALELESNELGFFKDTWRKEVEGMKSEGTITQELFKLKVKGVPDVKSHGDVLSPLSGSPQCTRTQDYITAPWVKSPFTEKELRRSIVKHIHYRMFSKTLGCSLHQHKDINELLGAFRDMVDIVVDAKEKSRRFHRDISASNVILVRDPETKKRTTYVIDWEFSVEEGESRDRCYMISGTWQFISHRLLEGDSAPHQLEDDLESIFWVAYWYLLIYYSDLSVSVIARVLRGVFDHFVADSGGFIGGKEKALMFRRLNSFSLGFESPQALPVKEWLNGFGNYFVRFWISKDFPQLNSHHQLSDLRDNVLTLPDTPITLDKQARAWEEITTYQAPGLSESGAATRSASSIMTLGSKEDWSVSRAIAVSVGIRKTAGTEGGDGVSQEAGGRVHHDEELSENQEEEDMDGRGKSAKRARVDSEAS